MCPAASAQLVQGHMKLARRIKAIILNCLEPSGAGAWILCYVVTLRPSQLSPDPVPCCFSKMNEEDRPLKTSDPKDSIIP